MLTVEELAMLLEIAKSASLQRAGDAHRVSDLFKKVEATLEIHAQEEALKRMQARVAAEANPRDPPKA